MEYKCPSCGVDVGSGVNAEALAALQECPHCGGQLFGTGGAMVGRRVGDYVLERHIGSGGMGEVFIANQISMKRPVAVKILQAALSTDSKYLERFFREVRLLAQIEHPNVVRAIEAGMDGDICFFSMEYVPGNDLKRQIGLHKCFEEREAVRIGKEVALALSYAWEKHSLIHRDVKPANIIMSPEGDIKLMDLGISKRQKERSDLTMAGMMVGSPTYMSPEQARAQEDIDFRADMYSLGATLYHLLAGIPPYEAESPMGVITRHLTDPVPDIRKAKPGSSEAVAELIRRMMAKRKEDRFASWQEAIDALDAILDGIDGQQLSGKAEPAATSTALKAVAPAQPRPEAKPASGSSRLSALAGGMRWHRIVSLLILLVLFLMAFTSVVRRSVREARDAQERKSLEGAIREAEAATPERRPASIRRMEIIARDARSKDVAERAMDCIESLKLKSAQERAAAEAEKRAMALKGLKRDSFKLENAGLFEEAIRIWDEYSRSGEFRSDPAIAMEIRNSLDYLKRKKESKDAGVDE